MVRKNETKLVMKMANLERNSQMSAIQLAIMIVAVQLDTLSVGFSTLLRTGGHIAWLSVIAGGTGFYFSAYMAIRLAQKFPDETFAEYIPRLWGKWLGGLVLLLYFLAFLLHTWIGLQSSAREITFFMFDRTPYEIILATYIAASAYCALQDWGTIIRVVQMMVMTGIVILLLLLLLSGVVLQPINLFPLFAGGFSQLSSGFMETWTVFSGYLILLVLMPLIRRREQNVARVVGYGFAFITFVVLWAVISIIAGLGIKTAQNVSFPFVTLIRAVEIPGTFLERLDTYLVTIKVMLFFNSMSVVQYVKAVMLMKYFGHSDHRPWVLAFVPILFIGSDALHTMRLYHNVRDLSNWLGFIVAFGIIPITLYLAKRRQDKQCHKEIAK
jgi:spore germination protein